MRIMALDIGSKTIGIALSDAMKITAQPLKTLRFQNSTDSLKQLHDLVKEHEVDTIVAGLPLHMNGSEGERVEKTKTYMDLLSAYLKKRGLSPKLDFFDERLSTVEAERVLLQADVSRKKRKESIDKLAASIILQAYLESL